MEKMLITQALNELKVLDNRINKEITNLNAVTSAKTSESNVTPNVTKEEYKTNAISSYDSIRALINRRMKIKNAIIDSNAKTKVIIRGDEMTVASAIDLKNSIMYEMNLLNELTKQYNESIKKVEFYNQTVQNKIDSLVLTAFGKDSKNNIKESDYESIAKPYREKNEMSIVDPLGAEGLIKKMGDRIEEYRSTVDSILQISNCTTYIEI